MNFNMTKEIAESIIDMYTVCDVESVEIKNINIIFEEIIKLYPELSDKINNCDFTITINK